ncbi:maleylpyruvate isomerase N-terminal domain-containing protein [Jiella sp. M17.18]|uniref:maleylpyruvate isomerase N-terminal domain-containing protein n=1 Tax=Jiella sp. M17.18 TaxID=3234247 RepID=UPI0034DFAD79
MTTLDEARAALRERQGSGARYDAPEAPAVELGWARLGTAYFARLLNDLPDADLAGPSLVPGWTRRHVVADVGYHARALTRLTEWAADGVPRPMYASRAAQREEIASGATLPARALRGLFRHAAVHLDVEWRDLNGPAWDAPLTLPDGRRITARDTAWLRARRIWLRAVDLGTGGSLLDAPREMVDRMLAEAIAAWDDVPVALQPTDRPPAAPPRPGNATVSGRAADLVRWLAGRGAHRLTCDRPLPRPPMPDLTDS